MTANSSGTPPHAVPTTRADGGVDGVARPPADGNVRMPVVGPAGTPSGRVPMDQSPLGGRPGPAPQPPLTPNSRPLPRNPDEVLPR